MTERGDCGGTTALALAMSTRRVARVLVADASNTARNWAVALRHDGLQVECVTDGVQAARLLREAPFDVVVADERLHGLDGLSLLRAAKTGDPDVAFLLTTSNPCLDGAVSALDLGALRYLVKPFTADLLIEAVHHGRRVCRLARLRRASLIATGAADMRPGDITGLDFGFSRALASLWVGYQPIVDGISDRPRGWEALLRSEEPTLPTPVEVLASAERLGRLHELGQVIRDKVAATAAEIDPDQFLTVNLHPYDLADATLFAPTAPLSRVADRIILEITEHAPLQEIADGPDRLRRLRELGFRIAIDDFGGGYAGLSSFACIEPNVVKLDMALIRDVDRQPLKRKLVQSMVAVCREMGMVIVAEGVERTEQHRVLQELGCELFQGHLFGTAAPWAAVLAHAAPV